MSFCRTWGEPWCLRDRMASLQYGSLLPERGEKGEGEERERNGGERGEGVRREGEGREREGGREGGNWAFKRVEEQLI